MVEFEVKSKKQTIGKKKGQTVYYAVPKSNQHMTLDALCDMLWRCQWIIQLGRKASPPTPLRKTRIVKRTLDQ